MKIYSKKFYNGRLPENKQLDRLKIPSASVKDQVLDGVMMQDRDIMQFLIDNRIIPTLVTNSELRNNPYYELEDKLISCIYSERDSRTYQVPVPGNGIYGEGNIYIHHITIYDDGSIKFGDSKKLDVDRYSPSTLKQYFRKYS